MKITKNIGYAISWLNNQGNSIEKIADELKLTTEQVTKYIEKNCNNKQKELPIKSSSTKSSKDLMIRHTRDKKINSVSIMTGEASSINDEMRKKNFNKSRDNAQHIFKPNK